MTLHRAPDDEVAPIEQAAPAAPPGRATPRPADTAPAVPAPAAGAGAVSAVGSRLGVLLGPLLVVLVAAAALTRLAPAAPGPFYQPPDPLPPGDHGTVVRAEPLAAAPPGARAWRVLYLSTGVDGIAVAVSGSVIAPAGAAPPGGRPVVAWAHPTTGVASTCGPSTQPDGGAADVPGLAALVAAGYVVTMTDYPGLGTPGPHPYLVGESEGMAVLDSARAARGLAGTGAGRRVAVWGQAQGGHAALFAGQLAPTYTPDLDLVGVAAAAPATELAALLQRDIGGVAGNVLASMALVSWSQVYAREGLAIGQVAEPGGEPVARLVAARCVARREPLGVDLPDAEILRLRFHREAPWRVPAWAARLSDNTPGSVPIRVPVLVTQGTADTVVWPGVTAEWVAGQCARGVPVTRRDYDGVSHVGIGAASAADTVGWLADRFAGRPTPSCLRPG